MGASSSENRPPASVFTAVAHSHVASYPTFTVTPAAGAPSTRSRPATRMRSSTGTVVVASADAKTATSIGCSERMPATRASTVQGPGGRLRNAKCPSSSASRSAIASPPAFTVTMAPGTGPPSRTFATSPARRPSGMSVTSCRSRPRTASDAVEPPYPSASTRTLVRSGGMQSRNVPFASDAVATFPLAFSTNTRTPATAPPDASTTDP